MSEPAKVMAEAQSVVFGRMHGRADRIHKAVAIVDGQEGILDAATRKRDLINLAAVQASRPLCPPGRSR